MKKQITTDDGWTTDPQFPFFWRAVAVEAQRRLKRTHVVVGDHAPEPRARKQYFFTPPIRISFPMLRRPPDIFERREQLEWEADAMRQGK